MKDKRPSKRPDAITDRFIRSACKRLAEDKVVRRRLPLWGRLHIDRQLPFLCVYRRPPSGGDAGTARLVTSEASYLLASGKSRCEAGLRDLVRRVVQTLAGQFGAFLVLEVWSGRGLGDEEPADRRPRFRVVAPRDPGLGAALGALEENLRRVKVGGFAAEVQVARSARWSPGRLPPLLTAAEAGSLNCSVAGLEVGPIYRDPGGDDLYPLVLRALRRSLTRALRRAFFDFIRSRTTRVPEHYHMLGRRAMVKAVWEVDRQLAEVSDSFDFLLQVTPVNAEQAWREFRRERCERRPVFRYRPLPVDPALLKRRLYATPIEKVEDPALAQVFREKQDEMDRQITMLADIGTSRFLHGSLQLYGGVSEDLAHCAEEILDKVSPRAGDDGGGGHVHAEAFAEMAREEIGHYRRQWRGVSAGVQVRNDIATGLMVSHGSLLVGRSTRIPASRAEALLHHEVGTHVLTYYNGRAQPFRQLYCGLAGYEALQEGIAVLAEYLVGGLSRRRLRLLAARVAAVRHLVQGASFADAFRLLHDTHGYSGAGAFTIAMRVYRGGGLTKDAVYLQGLRQVLAYLGAGGGLERLLAGKIAARHVPIIRELGLRGVLKDPPLRPRYLDLPGVAGRLERLRGGVTVSDLLRERVPRQSARR